MMYCLPKKKTIIGATAFLTLPISVPPAREEGSDRSEWNGADSGEREGERDRERRERERGERKREREREREKGRYRQREKDIYI